LLINYLLKNFIKIKKRVAVKGGQSPPPPMNVGDSEVKLQLNYKFKNNNLNQNCG
jgi:hypothetical protein